MKVKGVQNNIKKHWRILQNISFYILHLYVYQSGKLSLPPLFCRLSPTDNKLRTCNYILPRKTPFTHLNEAKTIYLSQLILTGKLLKKKKRTNNTLEHLEEIKRI